jgi:hypothetical protein
MLDAFAIWDTEDLTVLSRNVLLAAMFFSVKEMKLVEIALAEVSVTTTKACANALLVTSVLDANTKLFWDKNIKGYDRDLF